MNLKIKLNLNLRNLIFLAPFMSLIIIFFISLFQDKLSYLQFYLLAADSFYYFSVASEKAFSFDNVYLTNGFHPIWQVLLVLLNQVGINKFTIIPIALLFNLFFLMTTVLIFYKMFYEKIFRNPLILFLIVPGTQYLFLVFSNKTNYLHFFSFLNGMESSLTILFITLLIFLFRKQSINQNYTGILFLLIVLTRLDNIFLLISYSLIKIYKTKKIFHKEILISSIGISFYLILNKYIFGTYLPVSGLTKASFSLLDNYSTLFNIIIANSQGLNSFNTNIFNEPLFWRIIQVFFPFSFSIYFYYIMKKFKITKSYFTEALLLFIFLKSAYYFFTSNLWTQGHWYFPALFIIISFLLIEYSSELNKMFDFKSLIKTIATLLIVNWSTLIVYKLLDRYSKSIDLFEILYIPILISLIITTLVVISSLFYSSIFNFKVKIILFIFYFVSFSFIQVNHFINGNYNLKYYKFSEQQFEINNAIKKIKNYNSKLLSFDDGMVNFYLNSEVMNGTKLSIDSDAYFRSKTESIYDIAYSRGYRYFGSLNYLSNFDEFSLNYSYFMDDITFNKYHIKTVYESNSTGFKVFEFIEK